MNGSGFVDGLQRRLAEIENQIKRAKMRDRRALQQERTDLEEMLRKASA